MVDSLTWLSTTLILIAALNLLAVLICLGLLALGRVRTRRLVEVGLEELDEWPSVSLIVPARNEELYIEKAVRSLTRLDYPRLQITIIDDRSTDRTGAMLDSLVAEFSQLNVVHVTELPAGWLGKNHAMQLGADRSTGEWLLFTDADIVYEPKALRRAMLYVRREQLDNLSAWPVIHAPSGILSVFMTTFAIYLFLFVRVW